MTHTSEINGLHFADLRCDACSARSTPILLSAVGEQTARRMARDWAYTFGWRRVGEDEHLCPVCMSARTEAA